MGWKLQSADARRDAQKNPCHSRQPWFNARERMKHSSTPLDLKRLKVRPLAERQNLSTLEEILVDPAKPPPPVSAETSAAIRNCAAKINAAQKRNASVMLIYGAHLVKNGLLAIASGFAAGALAVAQARGLSRVIAQVFLQGSSLGEVKCLTSALASVSCRGWVHVTQMY